MDGATFINRFRVETADEVEPFLWKDSAVLQYLSEAQYEFCRRTDGIADSVSSVCTVRVKGATAKVSPLIKKVRAATLAEPRRLLRVMSVEEARDSGISLASPVTGLPLFMVTGVGNGLVQFHPAPAAPEEVVVHLDVLRYPLNQVESPGDELELGDEVAPILMHYVLHRAYARPDADTYDRGRSEAALAAFLNGCREAQAAQSRARSKSGAVNFSW